MKTEIEEYPEAIFFDWDGTLVDTLEGVLGAHNHVRNEFGLPLWDMADFKGHMHKSSRETYPELYEDKAEKALNILWTYFEANHLKGLYEMPGAGELLSALKDNAMPVGLISNKRHDILLKEVQHLNWERYFETIIGAGKAEKDKPDSAPLRMGFSHLNKSANDNHIWYVGDTRTDMEAADAADCYAVLILHGEDKPDLIDTYNPKYVFSDCLHLQNTLLGSI